MKRYRCPKCKTEFVGKLEHCPNCGIELHYIDEEVKKAVKVPTASFHYDDPDVNSKGIEEEYLDQEVESKPVKSKQPVYNDKPENNARVDAFGNYLSYFDGFALAKFGLKLLTFILTIISVFIALPWTMCLYYRWEAKHTVIEGRRLVFDGKGIQLFGRYMLWFLLTILTVGIFAIFTANRLHSWKISHTHFSSTKNLK